MTIPSRLLIHDVTISNPTTSTDSYGNTVYSYPSGTRARGWVQQSQRTETFTDGRTADVARWLLITNACQIENKARIGWTGPTGAITFEVDGPPEPVYSGLAQTYHHTETYMRVVTG